LAGLGTLEAYYSNPDIPFPSDRSIGVVTYEIFSPSTMQDQQQQLQMIWLNDHRAINENLEKKGRIIFNSPLSHDSALWSGVVLSGRNEIRLERNLL
jgi:hypothetical protein